MGNFQQKQLSVGKTLRKWLSVGATQTNELFVGNRFRTIHGCAICQNCMFSVYICIYVYIYIYVYTCIYRERERERARERKREKEIHIYIYALEYVQSMYAQIHMYTHTNKHMHMHIHTASRATATGRWHYCSCRTEFNVIKTYVLRCTYCIYSVRITLHSGLQLHRFVFPLENCIQGSPFFGCLEMMFWRDLVSKRDILRPWCRSTRCAWGCFLALGKPPSVVTFDPRPSREP